MHNKYFLIDNTRIIIAGSCGYYSGLEKKQGLLATAHGSATGGK
jgi:hypothetical protein